MVECQRCGKADQTLRATSFIYTFSIIVMTFRRGTGGVFCASCRRKEGLKYSAVSAIFGRAVLSRLLAQREADLRDWPTTNQVTSNES